MQIFADKKFEHPIEIIEAFDTESFIKAFSRIEILKNQPDIYLLGYIRYEAKDIFLEKNINSKLPLLYFEVFKNYDAFKEPKSKRELIISKKQLINFEEYSQAISKIKEEIAEGNTYEVNYTYDWKVHSNLEGLELFNSILPKQKTSYCAYIKNKYEEILSFSPELFFELNGEKITTKPMKGTIKRALNEEDDKKNIGFLKNDEKNRAENVMIVDLLRNDLGKIAKTGSVKVEKLFAIETHPTLHQMTSQISAELKEGTSFFEIFEAIFPCGSITGAPKISTMNIIEKIEEGSRGVYCGAIGLISKEKTVFSVPIRILRKTNDEKDFLYRVGGAIVWDSTAEEEWQETLTKTSFLSSSFRFVETMLIKDGKIQNLDKHLTRIEKSAKEFGFIFDKEKKEEIKDSLLLKMLQANELTTKENKILRLLINQQGDFEIQILPLDKIKTNRVIISKRTIDSTEKLLYHKTTHRPWYENSMKKIKNGEIFDEIFFNEKGELSEGARSNLILQIGYRLYTPPVKCGLLNGITRQKLIDENKLTENTLYLKDLKSAEKVYCINSIRGIVEVKVDFN